MKSLELTLASLPFGPLCNSTNNETRNLNQLCAVEPFAVQLIDVKC